METIQRHIENVLNQYLFQGKVLLILGARQVGKTTMIKHLTRNNNKVLWLNADVHAIRDTLTDPSLETLSQVVGSYQTIVIDEVQRIKNAGLLLKLLVDHFPQVQFIATGSSSLEISEQVFEPLTGRSFQFYLYPFMLSEVYDKQSPFEIEQKLPFHLVYGNYPEVFVKKEMAEIILKNLSQNYLYKDVLMWKDIRKPELLDKILQLLAWQIGSEVSIHELSKTLRVNVETVESYIDLLEKSFVVFRLKAYATNPRKEISKMRKIYFWDNGIRNAIIDNFKPLKNRNDVGALFENFMIGERLKYNSMHQSGIKSFFWRNYNQSEVDYVEWYKQHLNAYEIKWNKHKNYRISKAFTNKYPEADTHIINPLKIKDFLF